MDDNRNSYARLNVPILLLFIVLQMSNQNNHQTTNINETSYGIAGRYNDMGGVAKQTLHVTVERHGIYMK